MTKTDKENIVLLTEQYKHMNEVVNGIKTDVEKLSNKFDNVGVKKTSKMINILIKQRAIVLLWIIMFIKNKWGV